MKMLRGAPRVVLTDAPWGDVSIERDIMRDAGFEFALAPAAASSDEALDDYLAKTNADAVMTCWKPVSASAIARLPHLRIVARMGVGLDNIRTAEATDRGVWVTTVPDYCVHEVSEHAIGLLLALTRRIATLDAACKAGRWGQEGVALRRLAGMTVGIVGYGTIGRFTATKLSALGCTVLISTLGDPELADGLQAATLERVQSEADAIILHLPLTDATRGLLDDAFFSKCRRRPFIVNVSRGGLVDNEALVRALDDGSIGGAALDVVDGEPNPSPAVIARLDVIATPHVAYLSDVSLRELRTRASKEVVRVLSGLEPEFPANRPRLRPNASQADTQITTAMTGGVSSDIHLVRGSEGTFVVKHALGRLRVTADWTSDPSRSLVEVDALRTIRALLGADCVPEVLWVDAEEHRFAMEFIDLPFVNWKQELLAGRVDLKTAARAGELLGALHARSMTRDDLRTQFDTTRFFRELRIVPYFIAVADRNPLLAKEIQAVVDGISRRRTALVHGDYSPKNMLVDGERVVILDCEVAHWGDPRFDLAFCICHLVLKAERRDANPADFVRSIQALMAAYAQHGPQIVDADLWRVLACLLLARLEGDSPVEYLHELNVPRIKRMAVDMLQAERPHLADYFKST